jgi:class 3 adenylate cyclase
VAVLNELFSVFDRLAQRHGLEKIKTIGDAYMVAGGLPEPRPDHAEAVAEMALAMQAEVARRADPSGRPLQLRIGIDTATVGGAGNVVDSQADDADGRLGEQQHQAGSHPRAQGTVVVGEDLAEQLQPAVLGDRRGPAAPRTVPCWSPSWSVLVPADGPCSHR